jgi:hypothetical protein
MGLNTHAHGALLAPNRGAIGHSFPVLGKYLCSNAYPFFQT